MIENERRVEMWVEKVYRAKSPNGPLCRESLPYSGLGITTHRQLGLEKAVNSLGQPVRPMEWGLRRAELKTAVKRAFDATRRTNARTDVHSIEV